VKKKVNPRRIPLPRNAINKDAVIEEAMKDDMMDQGHIILDTAGEERAKLRVSDLLVLFREAAGRNLDNDRMMLS